jgi:hypothetical protein
MLYNMLEGLFQHNSSQGHGMLHLDCDTPALSPCTHLQRGLLPTPVLLPAPSAAALPTAEASRLL